MTAHKVYLKSFCVKWARRPLACVPFAICLSYMDGVRYYSWDKVARTFIPFLWHGFQKHSCCQGNPSWKTSLTAVTAGGSFSPVPPLLFPDILSDQLGLGAALKKGVHCGYRQQESLQICNHDMLVIGKICSFCPVQGIPLPGQNISFERMTFMV